MAGFLDQMAAGSRARADAAMASQPLAALRARCADLLPPPSLVLGRQFDVIAELKLRSPALGALGRAEDGLVERVCAYAAGGAAAVSVLTEPDRFDGSLDHLAAAAAALAPLGVPAMRKDFLVDPYQLFEARAAGAGGALLIIRMLSRDTLGEMLDCARELGLFVLLEAFDEADLAIAAELADASHRGREPGGASRAGGIRPGHHSARAAGTYALAPGGHWPPRPRASERAPDSALPDFAATPRAAAVVAAGAAQRSEQAPRPDPGRGAGTAEWARSPLPAGDVRAERTRAGQGDSPRAVSVLVGVNCRDLQTLEVVPSRFAALSSHLPAGVPRVAESGLETAADVEAAVRAGYDVALIGGALMRAGDPQAALGALLAAGRGAAA